MKKSKKLPYLIKGDPDYIFPACAKKDHPHTPHGYCMASTEFTKTIAQVKLSEARIIPISNEITLDSLLKNKCKLAKDYKRKAIEGWPGYEIDTDGNIWSCKLHKGQKVILTNQWRKLKAFVSKMTRYKMVSLSDHGRESNFTIHRLLAKAFIPNPNNYPHVCHRNGDRSDNRIENLRWDTPKGNMADKKLHGTSQWGERQHFHKLTTEEVLKIRELYATGEYTSRELSKMFNVSESTTGRVVKRKMWTHINMKTEEAKKFLRNAIQKRDFWIQKIKECEIALREMEGKKDGGSIQEYIDKTKI